jgi:hypothetical protein
LLKEHTDLSISVSAPGPDTRLNRGSFRRPSSGVLESGTI